MGASANISTQSRSPTPGSLIDADIDASHASALLLLHALPVSDAEQQTTHSLDILRIHSVSAATVNDSGDCPSITSLTPPTSFTPIPSSSPSLSLPSANDDRSVDVLLATQPILEASASSLPAADPAAVTVRP